MATRARIVLWWAEGRAKVEIAAPAGVSRPTVDLWLSRFAVDGVAGPLGRRRGAPREQVSAAIRGRIVALTRTSPLAETGLSHWSSREVAAFIQRTSGVYVSHRHVAALWRETGLRPHRQGMFKVSRDPAFAEKVADVVGLSLSGFRLWRRRGGAGGQLSRIGCRSSGKSARPYVCRLRSLTLVLAPSIGPLLWGRLSPATTAGRSLRSSRTKEGNAGRSLVSTAFIRASR